jgi:hypothetical protein
VFTVQCPGITADLYERSGPLMMPVNTAPLRVVE